MRRGQGAASPTIAVLSQGHLVTMLQELVARLDELDPDAALVARRPFTPSSPAEVAYEDEDGRFDHLQNGLSYVLDVVIAREVIEVWSAWRDRQKPTVDEATAAVIHYANNDAYLPLADE